MNPIKVKVILAYQNNANDPRNKYQELVHSQNDEKKKLSFEKILAAKLKVS